MKKLPTWTEIYPQGTTQGSEEQKFFISLARDPKYKFKSPNTIHKETKLPIERVEGIIDKYVALNMIIQNPNNQETYAYWENVPDLIPKEKSITKTDQDNRISKHKNQGN